MSKSKTANSFVLFGRAFKNAKKDFWVSIEVLLAITFVLAIVFYIVEHAAQPDEYPSFWQAFVWSITRYIGDPGHFSGNGPVTLVGRYIDTAIGILKILIFAVPAGLVANGFRKAMEDEKKRLHLENIRERMHLSFTRNLSKVMQFRYVPRYKSIVTLQAQKGLTEKDIIDAASRFDEFRLRNLATSQVAEEHPNDRLVVEMIPLDEKTVDGYEIARRSYGVRIDRGSNVTIVAPTSVRECSIGHFSYYLAQFGGFNYVSKEFERDMDDPVSYYSLNDDATEPPLQEFIEDIRSLSSGKGKWVVYLLSSDNVYDTQFHFVHKGNVKAGCPETTTSDEQTFFSLYDRLLEVISNHQFSADLDVNYRPLGKKNIGFRVAEKMPDPNFFSLRICYTVTTWLERPVPLIVDLAKEMKRILEAEDRKEFDPKNPAWRLKGHGYGESNSKS